MVEKPPLAKRLLVNAPAKAIRARGTAESVFFNPAGAASIGGRPPTPWNPAVLSGASRQGG